MIKARTFCAITACILLVAMGGCTSEAKDKIDKNIEACVTYYKSQNYDKAVQSGKKAIKSSPKNPDSHYWLAASYQSIGEFKLAIEELKMAESFGKDKPNVARVASRLGSNYSRLGDKDEAIRQFSRALLLSRELGYNDNIAINLSNLATIYLDISQYDKALEYYQEALKLQPGDSDIATMYINMAFIYGIKKNLDNAKLFGRKAIDISERIGDYHNQAIYLIKLGSILAFYRELETAEGMLLDGLKKIQKVGDSYWEGQANCELGTLYRYQDNKAQAAEYYKRALAIYTRLGNKEGIETAQSGLDKISKIN